MTKKRGLVISLATFVLIGLFTSSFSADPWDGTKDYTAAWRDTVTYGTFEGKTSYWLNKWYISSVDRDTPGCVMDSGGTSGWLFLNTMDPYSNYQWEGCDLSSGSEIKVCIPTWKDGAKGAYSLIHDDICSMDWNTMLAKSLELTDKYDIKVAYGTFVGKCDANEWDLQLELVKKGHEIVCHSHNHRSAAETWQWFWHGNQVPHDTVDPSIPPEWALLIVDTTIQYSSSQLNNPGGKVGWNAIGWNDDAMAQVKMVKLFCYDAWTQSDYYLNVDSAKALMDKYIYERFQGNQYFSKDKRTEYYVYPYDAYSNYTHEYLDQHGFIAARGGSKCSVATSGDFYHPYRSDFDSYYDEDMGVYPNNPHMWLKLKDLVDGIVNHKGYMIRELHAVSPVDQYWGAVTEDKYDTHLQYVRQKIDAGDITNLTPSEAVKQRLTVNACGSGEISDVEKVGDKEWVISLNCGSMAEKYKDEISLIVAFPTSEDDWNQVAVLYDGTSNSPRMIPKKLGTRRWAIYANPFKGDIKVLGDATGIEMVGNKPMRQIKFVSFIDGIIKMYLRKGVYKATLFNSKGRIVYRFSDYTDGGLVKADLNAKNLSSGFYILNVKHSYGLLRQRIVLTR